MLPTPPESHPADNGIRVAAVRTSHGHGVIGVPREGLRLSWQVAPGPDGAIPTGYEVAARVAEGWDVLATGDGTGGIAVPIAIPPSWDDARLRVRVRADADWSRWSEPLHVEFGLTGDELAAEVISIPTTLEGPVALLRREFSLAELPEKARLRLSALGLVDAWINGRRATDAHLTPGWTAYQERVLVDTLDVTALLRGGANVIVLAVADGWYRGRMGFQGRVENYGAERGAIAQIDSELGVHVATDASWSGGFGAVRAASIYDGSAEDQSLAVAGIHEPGFADPDWRPVSVLGIDKSVFEPRSAEPVRTVAELPMTPEPRAGATLLDAGQNIAGWVRLTVRGDADATVTVRHAEVLEPSGELHTAALRTAKATDVYILGHDGEHVLEPQFTFHGFRYAEVTGAEVVGATAVAISSDLRVRSGFTSSHGALDQFHSNVFWSQRDNFVSLPTDCPQRDERLGWTGDAQAFAATAVTLMESEAFWMSWLRDLEIDQTDEGGVASVVPNILPDHADPGIEFMGRAGWADAATIVPFAVYESHGNDEVLVRQLSSMRRWVDHLRRRAGTDVLLPSGDFQYGDWLDPDAPGDRPWQAKVSSAFVANAFYAHSARLLSRAEALVGDPGQAAEYATLADEVAAHAWDRWGEAACQTQTGASLALEFDIAPHNLRADIAAGLARSVREERGRIATGFLGTPLVLHALSKNGYVDEAYLMLLRREAPSWLYQVDRGATTVWERWDAIAVDGSIHDGKMDRGVDRGMLSFNHYAYGAVIDWVYRNVAGIAPDLADPGYRTIRVAPRPAVGVDRAAAHVDAPLGRVAIDWRLADDELSIRLDVPAGARAVLDLPTTDESVVDVGGRVGVTELGAGAHAITVTHPRVAGG